MGNKNKSGRPTKRKFQGNRHIIQPSSVRGNNEAPIHDNDNSSPSAKKIKQQEQYISSRLTDSALNGFILMDKALLFHFLSSNMRCEVCHHYTLSCELNDQSKCGFSHEISVKCTNCKEWETNLKSSGEGDANGHKEVNLRMVAFVRSIGRGYSALQNFSLYMNSPDPMTNRNYLKIFNKIHSASREVATESMNAAATELREKLLPSQPGMSVSDASQDQVVNCAVSADGSWQRRGHSSHHGVVTAISVETGKCVEVEVLSNICKGCKHWEDKKGTTEYQSWLLTHNCRVNHNGSAGAMEAVGAVRMFSRSEEKCKLRYTQYLGDGDSASFKKVMESKPYGETIELEKLECVGHVQKRCGTRLRRLVNENKGKKLSDGKGIGGIGRLTGKKIDTLQNYYGFAIRQNAGNLQQMQSDVKAVLHHVGSSAQAPKHDLCPADSWCKFKTDPTNYKHKNGLPPAVIEFIKPIFEDLSDEKLLRKCLHGKTQNNNECLNKIIWDRCSKEYFVEKETIEQAVYSAVAYFNDGSASIIKLFEKFGFCGHYTVQACAAKDAVRMNASLLKSSNAAKKKRKTLRAIRKGFIDTAEAQEGDMYSAGGH